MSKYNVLFVRLMHRMYAMHRSRVKSTRLHQCVRVFVCICVILWLLRLILLFTKRRHIHAHLLCLATGFSFQISNSQAHIEDIYTLCAYATQYSKAHTISIVHKNPRQKVTTISLGTRSLRRYACVRKTMRGHDERCWEGRRVVALSQAALPFLHQKKLRKS